MAFNFILPALGVYNRKLETDKHYLLNDNSSFDLKEAYKAARTNIIFATAREVGCKKIIVTSASPGDGKTTSCINLAITFSQTGAKVLLIDADLRKPKIAGSLGLDKTKGLANHLGGFCTINEIIQKTSYGFDLIAAGTIPPNPAELLSSITMENLLDELSEKYDYIFIDTPPANIVTDSIAVSRMVSGVIMVVRFGYTVYDTIDKAIESFEFAQAKVIGFILNDITRNNLKYKYKYKNKFGYQYYDYGYSDIKK